MKYLKGSFLLFFFGCCTLYAQFDIPDKPEKQTSVYDYINLLSSSEKNSLEQKLIGYSDSTSTQIVIAIISSNSSTATTTDTDANVNATNNELLSLTTAESYKLSCWESWRLQKVQPSKRML